MLPTPGVGAVSCSSTGPGGYQLPGVAIHSLGCLSRAATHVPVEGMAGSQRGDRS